MRILLAASLLLPVLQDAPKPHPLDKPLEQVTAKVLQEYLSYLASDELEGRCAGFAGNDKATVFIAERFLAAGLKPIGDADERGAPTFFQHFKVRRGELTTRNCIGLLEGSDPKLKGEFVFIGAHHDHVGRLGQQRAGQLGKPATDDEIWNGADDNGSGTTALLGIVKAFGACMSRPKRSVVFMTFSAEEWGLLGSRHYVDHPILPLDRTVTMLNLDMVGRTDEEFVAAAYGLGTIEGNVYAPILEGAAKTAGLKWSKLDTDFGDGSDHIPFFGAGVPIVGISEKGPCPDYHRVTDHADRIAYPTMAKIAAVGAKLLFDVANHGGALKRNPAYARPVTPDAGGPRLGAYLESVEGDTLKSLGLAAGRGAMSINGFPDASISKAQGLLESDIIVAFNGAPFDAVSPREGLMENLAKVIRGEAYPLEVIRDSKPVTLQITWPMTGEDTKARDLIENWLRTRSPETERELMALGDTAGRRIARLDPVAAKALQTAWAIRSKADTAAKDWGTRWFVHRDKAGHNVGWLKISTSAPKDTADPVVFDIESSAWQETTRVRATCARDGRLSLLSVRHEGRSGVKERAFRAGDNATLLPIVLFIAELAPAEFHGTRIDPATGAPVSRFHLEKNEDRKFTYREAGREPSVIVLTAEGKFLRMTGATGSLEASTEGEIR